MIFNFNINIGAIMQACIMGYLAYKTKDSTHARSVLRAITSASLRYLSSDSDDLDSLVSEDEISV
jgi:hypothetical protein